MKGNTPMAKQEVEWLDEPNRAGMWCRLDGHGRRAVAVFQRGDVWYYNDEEGWRCCCDENPAKWALIHYEFPEPPESKVELPELPAGISYEVVGPRGTCYSSLKGYNLWLGHWTADELEAIARHKRMVDETEEQ